jgi:hypothetical protein
MQALADDGQALFFGHEQWNPSGWAIRVAMHDGGDVDERVEQLRKDQR